MLNTLLAYNVEDVLTLERLAVIAYNAKLAATPFADRCCLPDARPPANPFEADGGLIRRMGWSAGGEAVMRTCDRTPRGSS